MVPRGSELMKPIKLKGYIFNAEDFLEAREVQQGALWWKCYGIMIRTRIDTHYIRYMTEQSRAQAWQKLFGDLVVAC